MMDADKLKEAAELCDSAGDHWTGIEDADAAHYYTAARILSLLASGEWVMVPRVPTNDMRYAIAANESTPRKWSEALAAAPDPLGGL